MIRQKNNSVRLEIYSVYQKDCKTIIGSIFLYYE